MSSGHPLLFAITIPMMFIFSKLSIITILATYNPDDSNTKSSYSHHEFLNICRAFKLKAKDFITFVQVPHFLNDIPHHIFMSNIKFNTLVICHE